MKVLKFGGTSVGTPESLRSVREIVASRTEPCVVTVSALGGITDCLLSTAAMAAAGNGSECVEAELTNIRNRHRAVIEAVVPEQLRPDILSEVSSLIDEFETIVKAVGLLGELTTRSENLVASYGERMSCLIVTAMIPGARLAHSLDFMRTCTRYGKSVLDQKLTSRLIAETFGPLRNNRIIIVPGFIARDESGHISNLGRGGSDYTAAILAAELGADLLEIWTDVDGFMSADPRRVGDARIIGCLSFAEAMELCNFGAKVIYPPTIYPVFNKNIPIVIKNTFNPSAPGTLIAEKCSSSPSNGFLGVSAIADTALIELIGGNKADHERMINRLSANGIEPLMPDGRSRCGIHGANSRRAIALLNDEFARELIDGSIEEIKLTEQLAMLALVGRGKAGVCASPQFASSLNLAGIPLLYGPQQASPGTVAGMVPAMQLTPALQTIHSEFIQPN